jgi:putative tryptophan/tyrosine transport system substrate-binding protein
MRLIGLFMLTLSLFAAPRAADSQQTGKIPRIGYLSASSPSASGYLRKAFAEGLRDLGWTEGQNIVVEARWAEGNYDRLAGQAAELVKLNVDVIVAAGPNPVIRAAKQATSAVPIVMTVAGDPVGQGFIASYRRPGGNITGVAWDADPMITEKYFELLKEVIPGLRRVGAILDRGDPPATVYRKAAMQAAFKLGLTLHEAEVGAPQEIEKAFATITTGGAQAVFVYGSPLFFLHRGQFVALAVKYKLPAIHISREFVEAGALMCYGVRIRDLYRRAATYVDKILRGAKPADFPVEQPTKFELVINLKTAKALGLTIPQSLLVRADEIIQ